MQRLGQIAQHMGHHTRHGMMVAAAATVGSQVPAIEVRSTEVNRAQWGPCDGAPCHARSYYSLSRACARTQLDLGFPPAGGETVNLADRCAGKKILLLGLPGAFTPC